MSDQQNDESQTETKTAWPPAPREPSDTLRLPEVFPARFKTWDTVNGIALGTVAGLGLSFAMAALTAEVLTPTRSAVPYSAVLLSLPTRWGTRSRALARPKEEEARLDLRHRFYDAIRADRNRRDYDGPVLDQARLLAQLERPPHAAFSAGGVVFPADLNGA